MSKRKRYREMNEQELAKATKEYDAPNADPKPVPVPKAVRATERRIRKAIMGRPKIGEGSKKVLITVEGGLLREADKFANRKGLSRSELIALGLRTVMHRTRRSA